MTGKYLSEVEQATIVGMSKGGMSMTQILAEVGRPKATVSRVLKRYHERGTLGPADKCGRPRKLTDANVRILKRELMKNRRVPLAELAGNMSTQVCVRTLQKEVHELGINSRIAVKKSFLNTKHTAERLAFAREYLDWTIEDWNNVIWTDEASFEVEKHSRTIRVWRSASEKYQQDCLVPTFKSGRISIMVRGANTGSSKCYLVLIPSDKRTAKDFVEVVYEFALQHYYHHHDNYECLILMEDGAPVHCSTLPKLWREEVGIKKLKWPANSPDLNPLENLWKQCKDQVQLKNRPRNKDEMWASVNRAWENISQEAICKFVSTMPDRMRVVVQAHGGSTRW